jgi:hypothetical protein
MFNALFHPLVIISLSIATGVFVHDTRLDKAAQMALSLPSLIATTDSVNTKTFGLTGDPHTHAERGSLSQTVHELKSTSPRIQPRAHEDRKHLMQKHIGRGHHAFDNYNLPLVED